MTDEPEAETTESPIDHITVSRKGSWTRVNHDTPEADRAEAGFDLTSFGDRDTFEELLATLDLDPRVQTEHHDPQHAKVDKRPDDPDRDYGIFVWANEDVALITGNDPITGEYSDPTSRSPEVGYASYIGISGKPGAVAELYETIKDRAPQIKGTNPDEREFI